MSVEVAVTRTEADRAASDAARAEHYNFRPVAETTEREDELLRLKDLGVPLSDEGEEYLRAQIQFREQKDADRENERMEATKILIQARDDYENRQDAWRMALPGLIEQIEELTLAANRYRSAWSSLRRMGGTTGTRTPSLSQQSASDYELRKLSARARTVSLPFSPEG